MGRFMVWRYFQYQNKKRVAIATLSRPGTPQSWIKRTLFDCKDIVFLWYLQFFHGESLFLRMNLMFFCQKSSVSPQFSCQNEGQETGLWTTSRMSTGISPQIYTDDLARLKSASSAWKIISRRFSRFRRLSTNIFVFICVITINKHRYKPLEEDGGRAWCQSSALFL